MIHDPMCPIAKAPCCPWMGKCDCQCLCDWIAEIREDERMTTRTDDIICYLNVPIASVELMGLLVGLEDCVIDTDDSENIVIRRK